MCLVSLRVMDLLDSLVTPCECFLSISLREKERERERNYHQTNYTFDRERDYHQANHTLDIKRAPPHHPSLSIYLSQGRGHLPTTNLSLPLSLSLPLGVVGWWSPSPSASLSTVTVRGGWVVVFLSFFLFLETTTKQTILQTERDYHQANHTLDIKRAPRHHPSLSIYLSQERGHLPTTNLSLPLSLSLSLPLGVVGWWSLSPSASLSIVTVRGGWVVVFLSFWMQFTVEI